MKAILIGTGILMLALFIWGGWDVYQSSGTNTADNPPAVIIGGGQCTDHCKPAERWVPFTVGFDFVDPTDGGKRYLYWDYAVPGSHDCIKVYDAAFKPLDEDCEGDSHLVDLRGQGQVFFTSIMTHPVQLKYRLD